MFGRDSSWVADPTDLPGAGALEYSRQIGIPAMHPLVGGDSWGWDGSGTQPDVGLSRLVTDTGQAPSTAMRGGIAGQLDDWRDLFNWQHSPIPWVLLALLVAVGFLNLRVNTKVGPAHASFGLG